LDGESIRRLDRIYVARYRQALTDRIVEPLAAHLHLPKVPEPLSVSIAALHARRTIGAEVHRAPFPDDLRDAEGRRIGVKGTGPSAWITVTATDRVSDVLVWVDYAARVLHGAPVRVIAIADPSWLQRAPNRLTLAQALSTLETPYVEIQFQP
jgi:hypothetical protein